MAEKNAAEQSELSPATCRAARGLADWTQEDLAQAAGICRSTVRDFEKGRHELQRGTQAQIVTAFDEAGIVLLPAGAHGPGVCFRQA